MVFTKATATSTKRKKTADMPESPPKRVTRARAKAAGDSDMQSKVTKITTASAKVAAEKKRQAGTAKTTKRKTRADDEDANPALEEMVDELPKKETKTRGRQKRVKDEGEKKLETNDVSALIDGRSTKIPTPEEANADAPKPRGRPKKAVNTTNAVSAEANLTENSGPAKKSLRGRPPTIVAKPSTAKAIAKPPLTRKKVQFQDEKEKEKENLSLPAKALKKPALKAIGLKAKPIRKPATARGAARGRKVDEKENPSNTESTDKPHPLSPKKVTQMAQTCSVSSEDELSGEKTPTRVLCRSPVKPPMSPIRELDKPVSKLNLSSVDAPMSSEGVVPSSILASPARRPPSSPFKDAFKESPKRVNLGDSLVNAVSLPPHSPMKASLLQSPARRLAASPIKFNAPTSPTKSGFAIPVKDTATASKQAIDFTVPHLSQEKAIRSPLRALKSPDRPFKVYKINAAEQDAELKLTSPNTLVQQRNVDSSGGKTTTNYPTNDSPNLAADGYSTLCLSPSPSRTIKSTSVDCENSAPEIYIERAQTGNMLRPCATVLEPTVYVASVFSLASTSGRFEDSESEDELTTIHKSYAPTPQLSHGIFPNYFTRLGSTGNESKVNNGAAQEALASPVPGATAEASPMTPLAVQMTGWFTSSPEKKRSGKNERKRGIFSPAGPTLFDRPVQTPVFSALESPPKSSFFDDEMAVRDEVEGNSVQEQAENEEVCMDVGASQSSQTSEEYGDENALPLDPLLQTTNSTADLTLTCTPAKVFSMQQREIHTVSKVPLRPAGEDSPLKIPRKRSRSLAGPLSVVKTLEGFEFGYGDGTIPVLQSSNTFAKVVASEDGLVKEHVEPIRANSYVPQTPGIGITSTLGTPMRTVRKAVVPNVLKGAVVYVDVHTTEGADASGIFVDLLTQMGARCVKQWLWNPRSSTNRSGDEESNTSPDSGTPGSKVGITHVVYKDGGKRTLEKVREANGIVLCVGVGWVLE